MPALPISTKFSTGETNFFLILCQILYISVIKLAVKLIYYIGSIHAK